MKRKTGNIKSITRLFVFLFCGVLFTASYPMQESSIIASGTGIELTWKLFENGTLTISGNSFGNGFGIIPYYSFEIDVPWYRYRDDITNVMIGNDIVLIDYSLLLGYSAFRSCTGLMSIDVDNNNTAYCSEDGVLFNKTKTTLMIYPAGKTGAYNIPNSVTSIGNYTFQGCTGLTSVTIGNSVTDIGACAFSYCTGLTSVTIPKSVTSIESSAFYGCSGLTSVTIPNSVTRIGMGALGGCSGLTEIINESTVPQDIYISVFFGKDISTCTLRVPAAAIDAYSEAEVWKNFGNIVAI